jgi:Fic family protein
VLVRPYLLREAALLYAHQGHADDDDQVFEVDASGETPNPDVEEVVAYIDALEWELEQVDSLPLGTRLMRGMHRRLIAGVRGRGHTSGELRTTQNWIGAPGSAIETADFVPPPPQELPGLLTDWERFANEDAEMPLLIQNALLYSQFEMIPSLSPRQRTPRTAATGVLPRLRRSASRAAALPQRVPRARSTALLRRARVRAGDR